MALVLIKCAAAHFVYLTITQELLQQASERFRVLGARILRASTGRSEEHTSELQSQSNIVCRLLLEKNKKHRSNNAAAITSSAQIRRHLGHTHERSHRRSSSALCSDARYLDAYPHVHDR